MAIGLPQTGLNCAITFSIVIAPPERRAFQHRPIFLSLGTSQKKPPPQRPMAVLVLCLLALLALLALVLGVLRWRHGPGWLHPAPAPIHLTPAPQDTELGHFALCHGPVRVTCIIDGDTIWYRHVKIRLADINAPEVSEPACDHELDLGEKATDRLMQLLNEGRFSLVPLSDRDADVYGRKLRKIMRGGRSIGGVLVAEGLAERWVGFRRDWCS